MGSGVRTTLLALVALSITLGVSFWYQHRMHPEDQPAATAPIVSTHTPIASSDRIASVATGTAAPARSPSAAAQAAPSQEGESLPPPFSTVEVPASVLIGPGTDETGREATLRNSSARLLEVSITASNTRTGHQAMAQLTLSPFQRVSLADSGVRVEPGDVLTLHSPPFRDREIDVNDQAN